MRYFCLQELDFATVEIARALEPLECPGPASRLAKARQVYANSEPLQTRTVPSDDRVLIRDGSEAKGASATA